MGGGFQQWWMPFECFVQFKVERNLQDLNSLNLLFILEAVVTAIGRQNKIN